MEFSTGKQAADTGGRKLVASGIRCGYSIALLFHPAPDRPSGAGCIWQPAKIFQVPRKKMLTLRPFCFRTGIRFATRGFEAKKEADGSESAGVAQLVEQLTCNQQVAGSSPIVSSSLTKRVTLLSGGIPERPKGTDCKSVVSDFGGSNPPPSTI